MTARRFPRNRRWPGDSAILPCATIVQIAFSVGRCAPVSHPTRGGVAALKCLAVFWLTFPFLTLFLRRPVVDCCAWAALRWFGTPGGRDSLGSVSRGSAVVILGHWGKGVALVGRPVSPCLSGCGSRGEGALAEWRSRRKRQWGHCRAHDDRCSLAAWARPSRQLNRRVSRHCVGRVSLGLGLCRVGKELNWWRRDTSVMGRRRDGGLASWASKRKEAAR